MFRKILFCLIICTVFSKGSTSVADRTGTASSGRMMITPASILMPDGHTRWYLQPRVGNGTSWMGSGISEQITYRPGTSGTFEATVPESLCRGCGEYETAVVTGSITAVAINTTASMENVNWSTRLGSMKWSCGFTASYDMWMYSGTGRMDPVAGSNSWVAARYLASAGTTNTAAPVISYLSAITHYSPIINGHTAVGHLSTTGNAHGTLGVLTELEGAYTLELGLHLYTDLPLPTVQAGYSKIQLDYIQSMTPTSQNSYTLTSVSGEPMHQNNVITGIGNFQWQQTATDFYGDSTTFTRNVVINTEKAPHIAIVYATGALENTAFSDGTANGGVDGWSNIPLKATVQTRNADNTYIVDGYYFNRLNDELGGSTHGSAHKDSASAVYNASTTNAGIWLTGVMVDDAKTTELSATTEPVTIKIDMENPVAAVSYDTVTDTLVNGSSDTLSGLQLTKVAIVPAGAPVPVESDYVEFANWQTLINGNGEYDVYVIAIDNAGNQATTTLHNQLFTGSATSLEISKTVVGKYGEYNKPFEITVTLKDDANNLVNGSYEVTSSMADIGNYSVTFTTGKAVLHIRHGEMIAINGLPLGYTYTVQNTDKSITEGHSPYVVTYNGSASATGITNTLDSNVAQVMIASTRETIPDMGIFEENDNFAIGSTLLLFTVLITTITICERKRNLK